jgi:hypothetical protein
MMHAPACQPTFGLLGAIFSYAVRQGIRLDNPVHGIVKFAEARRQRRMADDEYRQLGMALSKARHEKVWQPAIAATWSDDPDGMATRRSAGPAMV